MMKQPYVGKVVGWFNGGCRANGMNPGIVTAVGNGVIRVNVFQPGNTGCHATNWIRHIDDPWNDSHTVARDSHGAWDWLDCDKLDAVIWVDEEITQAPPFEGPVVGFEPNVSSLPEIGRAARKKAKATS
jgi:hypothetical protein